MTGYMVKDHSAKEDKENHLPPFHGLLLLAARDFFFFLHASSHKWDSTMYFVTLLWSTGWNENQHTGSTTRDQFNNTSHHEQMI